MGLTTRVKGFVKGHHSIGVWEPLAPGLLCDLGKPFPLSGPNL